MKAQRGSRGIASTLSLSLVLDGGEWSTPLPGRLVPTKAAVLTAQEAWWAPRPVGTGAENLAPNRDASSGPSR